MKAKDTGLSTVDLSTKNAYRSDFSASTLSPDGLIILTVLKKNDYHIQVVWYVQNIQNNELVYKVGIKRWVN